TLIRHVSTLRIGTVLTSQADVAHAHPCPTALPIWPRRLRSPLCPGAPGNAGAIPAPSEVGTAGAPRTRRRAAPRCRLRVPPSAGWRGRPPAHSATARADRRWGDG